MRSGGVSYQNVGACVFFFCFVFFLEKPKLGALSFTSYSTDINVATTLLK